jgi:type IV secretion system protein TrbL
VLLLAGIRLPCTNPSDCVDAVTGIPGDIVGGAAANAIDALADSIKEAVGEAVAGVATLWVDVGTPNLTSTSGGSTASDPVAFLQDQLWWLMAGIAVLSVIFAGGRTAWEMRGEPVRAVALSLIKLTLVIGAATATIAMAVEIADGVASAIIDRAVENGEFGENIVRLIGLGGVTGLGAFLVIVMGLFALFASLVQIALMAARSGMLVILTGTLQVSAAATNTEMGDTWFKRSIAWLIAFVLYKPAAAIVYATAFKLSSSDVFADGGLTSAVCGIVLMFLALFALPALMRFTTPMVGAVADRGSGGGLGSAAAVALPTGAISVPRGGADGASGSNGGPGESGATGAVGVAGGRGDGGAPGSSGTPGSNGNGSGPPPSGGGQPGEAGAGAPSGAGEATAAGAGAGAGVGAPAGAAGGPAGAVAAAGMQAGGAMTTGAQQAAQSPSDDEGPHGSA